MQGGGPLLPGDIHLRRIMHHDRGIHQGRGDGRGDEVLFGFGEPYHPQNSASEPIHAQVPGESGCRGPTSSKADSHPLTVLPLPPRHNLPLHGPHVDPCRTLRKRLRLPRSRRRLHHPVVRRIHRRRNVEQLWYKRRREGEEHQGRRAQLHDVQVGK